MWGSWTRIVRWLLPIALMLAGCASPQKFALDDISSLTQLSSEEVGFRGLERVADKVTDAITPRVNVVYLHGIGWTEDPENEALGQDFLSNVARAYGLERAPNADGKCLRDTDAPVIKRDGLLYIEAAEPLRFETVIPGTFLEMERLACVDRNIIRVSDTLEIALYRIFWDEAFWEGLQSPHVGQDDFLGDTSLSMLRRKFNRQLKDEIVNYGFSDAVMYLGPTGGTIREAVRGAVCAAALDAGGYGFREQGPTTTPEAACRLVNNTTIESNAFTFISESLGSKIVFDIFRSSLTDGRDDALDGIMAGSEVYMLANQLPLLSLSDVASGTERTASPLSPEERPVFIGLSEVNDFLTYEVVPFLRQLWDNSEHQDSRTFDTPGVRDEIARRLGFDFIDLRMRFADPLIPLVSAFVDPEQAHQTHTVEPELIEILLCGIENGVLRTDGCLAHQIEDTR